LAKGGDLIIHQGDQRGDDEAEAFAAQGGDLIADALAATGRHQDERVATAHDAGDDIGLLAAEFGEAEDLTQGAEGGRGGDSDVQWLTKRSGTSLVRAFLLRNEIVLGKSDREID
jgi:hypothetical protein